MNKKLNFKWVRLPVALIFFGAWFNCSAQKISKFYTSSMQNAGMLYFVKPQSGFVAAHNGGKMQYDITAFAKADSLTINFSFITSKALHINAMAFNSAAGSFTATAHRLFVETKKLNWHYRYSLRIAQKDLLAFYSSPQVPGLILQCSEGNQTLHMNKRKWKKLAARNRRIFELIALN